MTPELPELLRAFSLVTHDAYAERDAERDDHAETKALAMNLERDLRREKALRVESETVRRGQAEELTRLRSGADAYAASRDHLVAAQASATDKLGQLDRTARGVLLELEAIGDGIDTDDSSTNLDNRRAAAIRGQALRLRRALGLPDRDSTRDRIEAKA